MKDNKEEFEAKCGVHGKPFLRKPLGWRKRELDGSELDNAFDQAAWPIFGCADCWRKARGL